ncbi:CvpA family membrane protein [Listeria floridensis FSL S10-1187]|uniref:CvpA family membrane protein n=1 Tax=Listeria floridensis FSL S10-1187 TaxID=1265817 RepID=A0ABN0RCI9_9LIST|nr:CvpA family protein [Listeria floridensis]EUJ27414.1 CvpA family membrane protein [Listeria floridensis FSL S10-1187]
MAYHYYELLSPKLHFIPYPELDKSDGSVYELLKLLHTEEAYYNILAFIFIFVAALIVVHMLTAVTGSRTKIPVVSQVNGLIGGLLGVIATYLFLFVFLYLGAAYPSEWLKNVLEGSNVAQWILENTPILSERFYDWMTRVITK